jgi:8-oxo-dGTP pyrophosphatase MutT (NUDIX family)
MREVAAAVVFDTSGSLLLQQRDNIPGILCPGKVALFGGHREGDETFLDCVVREIREELSYFIPPANFKPVAKLAGLDAEVLGGTILAEFFVTRDVPADRLSVTEGRLKIVDSNKLGEIKDELTPHSLFALEAMGLI